MKEKKNRKVFRSFEKFLVISCPFSQKLQPLQSHSKIGHGLLCQEIIWHEKFLKSTKSEADLGPLHNLRWSTL